jgi:hypothetical protein
MEKLLLGLLVVLCIGLASCEKEEVNVESENTNNIDYTYIKDTITQDGDILLAHFIEKDKQSAYYLLDSGSIYGLWAFDYLISPEYSDVLLNIDTINHIGYDVYLYLVRKGQSVHIYSGTPYYAMDGSISGSNFSLKEDEQLVSISREEYTSPMSISNASKVTEIHKTIGYADTPYKFTNY